MNSDLKHYQVWLKKRLKELAPVFAKAAVGDFSGKLDIAEPEDELTEFFVGVNIMLDTMREQVTEFESTVSQLSAANEIIANEKARVEAILNSLGECVLTVDYSWRTTYVNEPAIKLLGSDARVLSQDATEILPLEDENGHRIPAEKHPIRLSIGSNKQMAFGISSGPAYFVKTDSTQLRRVGMTITPIVRNNKVTGAAVIIRDITEENNVDRAKTEIISIASHQLRTPLTAIRWYAKTLLNDRAKLSDEQMQKYLQQIYDSNGHLVTMVDALLNVSRIDLGTLSFKPEPVDMAELLKEVLKELTVVAEARKLVMSVHISPNLLPVMMDRNALQIIFQNLLSNAIKYSNQGGEITVWLKQRSGNGEIIVSDSGIGIPETEQAKIYTKMYRASNATDAAVDGTGLGLYIVKAMVERAKGQITFQSTEGKGTTFYVIIPSKVD